MPAKIKQIVPPVLFSIFACAVAAFAIITTMYTDAYAVYIDNELWGYVTDTENTEAEIKDVEKYVGKIRDEEYSIDYSVDTEPTFVLNDRVVDSDEIYDYLYNTVNDITEGYVLKVDDEIIGIGDPDELAEVVEEIADQYIDDKTVGYNITSNVEVVYDTVPSETDSDIASITDKLESVSEPEAVYTTQDGDTVEKIIEENDLTESEFFSLNPELKTVEIEENEVVVKTSDEDADAEVDVDEAEDTETEKAESIPELSLTPEETADDETPIEKGVDIVVSPEQSLLTVETYEYESYKNGIEYNSEVEETDELYSGEYEIGTTGEDGREVVIEKVTYQNGVETNREETTHTIAKKAVNETILKGTKELKSIDKVKLPYTVMNTAYYSENYQWPLVGYSSISSGYGWRWLNGSSEFHKGLDIPAGYDTPIYASNGGTVITNQYNSARGWYVQIDHGDGYITTYQHMCRQSSLSIGQTVSKGQYVGGVGSTGYSFGNHLHFEVWLSDGTAIDPMSIFDGTAAKTTAVTTEETVDIEVSETTEEMAEEQDAVVEYAEEFIGNPYLHGGHGSTTFEVKDLIDYINDTYDLDLDYDISDTSPGVRSYVLQNYGINVPYVFDGSGFVGFLYHHIGYDLPYTVEGQIELGQYIHVDEDEMEKGDLIFFDTEGNGEATHTGMYIGDGQYIHVSASTEKVTTADLEDDMDTVVAVRRIVSD